MVFSVKEDRRKMENSKADNIAHKYFKVTGKRVSCHYARNISRSEICNMKQQIYLKIPTVGAVQVFSLELLRSFIFYFSFSP